MGDKRRGLLLVISGPSGVGKGTVCAEYLRRHDNACVSISATTRLPREGEIDGVNYFFRTKKCFEKGIEDGEYLEYATVHGSYYGTPRDQVEKCLNDGQDVILEIDVQGALQVKQRYQQGVYIFIMPPSIKELRRRIVDRGTETEEQIERRLGAAAKEMEQADKYDYVLTNDIVKDTVKRLEEIIESERL